MIRSDAPDLTLLIMEDLSDMLVRTHWDVLVVDDDPDVLAVSRLALKPISVYGIPIKVNECTSKAGAIEYLQATAEFSELSLAIIDVVMETEHAGLDVCKFIRENLNNRMTQIVVRTGQAGKVPERAVIECYEISTYLNKVEATTEKLHATVVNAVRNYQYSLMYEAVLHFTSQLILMGESRESVVRGIPEFFHNLLRRRDGSQDHAQFHFCILTEREAIAFGNFHGQDTKARALRDQLSKQPFQVTNGNGDRFTQVGDHILISLARTEASPMFDVVGETNYQPTPDYVVRGYFIFARCLRDQMVIADRRR